MGIFFEQVAVVNRAPVALNVRFDGQDITIPPGESQIPKVAVNYAKNQNPIMGTADPDNPSLSGGRYLIGVKGVDDCSFLSKPEWEEHLGRPCRLDWETLTEGVLKPGEHIAVKGKKAGVQAKRSFDAGVKVRGSQLNPIADNA